MNINLIDDTALVETTSIKNVPKKDRTILGFGHYHQVKTKPQESCSKMRKLMDFPEIQEGLLEFKKIQENGNVGFHIEKKKVILGCAESLKKQESFYGNDCQEKGKLMGFPQRVKIQENENVGFKKIQEKVSTRNCKYICGNENRIMGFDTNQEKNGKTIQVWVARRGKVQDKCQKAFTDEKGSTFEMVDDQSGNRSGKKIEGTSICYSRKQMEDLRFVNMKYQNKKWGAIYCGLGPVGKREYDELLDLNRLHNPQLDMKKKVTALRILGPMAANGRWNHWYLCASKNGLK